MNPIPHRRRPRIESLEDRNLLTVIVDSIYPHAQDAFTVRRDEGEPVELRVYFPFPDPVIADEAALTQGIPDRGGIVTDIVQSGRGTATINSDGVSILYRPEPGFVGIDVLTVLVQTATAGVADEQLELTERQIAVNVVEPLLAVDDWFEVAVSAERSQLDVLANDIHNARYQNSSRLTLTLQSSTAADGGQVELNDDQTELIYRPAAGFEGVESIVYTAVDEDGYTLQGTAQVRVSDLTPETIWPEQLQQQMVEQSIHRQQYLFGVSESVHSSERFFLAAGAEDSASSGDVDVSGTNNQLADVDESDRVKTDGEFLYVLTSPDANDWHGWGFLPWIDLARSFAPTPETTGENLLTVIDVRQPDAPTIVSRQLFDDRVESLDLRDDRLTVISQRHDQTVVTALDISDPTSLQTVWTTVVDGTFKQARRVAGTLYVFTDDYGIRVPELETICDPSNSFCFYETGQQYVQRVADSLTESFFPSQEVFDSGGDRVAELSKLMVDPLLVGLPDHAGRLNIIAFDTGSEVGGAIDWDVTDAAEHLLVTPQSIYVTRIDYGQRHVFRNDVDIFVDVPERPSIVTEVERFALLPDGTVDFTAAGFAPGTLNNSFSIDEHDGLLRVATENSWGRRSEQDFGSNIYILQQSDDALNVVGGVTGLAPGERIYAVRFAEDRGYVVTFRKVDPLFVVDLSEPTAPEVLGQLKTPGYSQYLHVIDQNHVIGVGRDADEETGLYGGLIVSLFNVSDPADPVVQDRFEFAGGRTTFSPFAEDNPWDLRDHHAISYFSESGVLALPVYSQHHRRLDQGDEAIFETTEQSAVQTFRIATESGIEQLDWITFDSRADRTLRIGEHLYSLSNEALKVTHLLQPDGVIASLQFERGGEDDFVDVNVGDPVTINVIDNDGVDTGDVEILDATLVEGVGDVEVVDGNRIRFTPGSMSLGQQRIRYTARDASGTLIDAVATVDPDIQWQNADNVLDVNKDNKTSARDALNVINMLKRYGGGDSEEIERQIGDADAVELFYFDTTGDGQLTARDALVVINDLIQKTLNADRPGAPSSTATDAVFNGFADEDEEDAPIEPVGLF